MASDRKEARGDPPEFPIGKIAVGQYSYQKTKQNKKQKKQKKKKEREKKKKRMYTSR